MNKLIIYGLIDPRTSEVRYIGKSTSGLKRPKEHLKKSKYMTEDNYKSHWIRSLVEQGIIPIIVTLKVTETAEALSQMEIDAIAEYRAMGARLTNLTDGGEGALGRIATEESRQNSSMGRAKYLATLTEPLKAPNKRDHILIDGVACKCCFECGETKPLSGFGTQSNSWDKLKRNCRICNAKRTAEWRATKPKVLLTEKQRLTSYENRAPSISAGLKKANENPELRKKNSLAKSKAIEGTHIQTGAKIYFNSALEAKAAGFQNSNLGQAIRKGVPYKGYMWRFLF